MSFRHWTWPLSTVRWSNHGIYYRRQDAASSLQQLCEWEIENVCEGVVLLYPPIHLSMIPATALLFHRCYEGINSGQSIDDDVVPCCRHFRASGAWSRGRNSRFIKRSDRIGHSASRNVKIRSNITYGFRCVLMKGDYLITLSLWELSFLRHLNWANENE